MKATQTRMTGSGQFHRLRQHLALLAGVTVLFAFLLSGFFLAMEQEHDCTGEACPVCSVLQACENMVRQLGTGVVALAVTVLPFAFLIFYEDVRSDVLFPMGTLVSQKVRMDN